MKWKPPLATLHGRKSNKKDFVKYAWVDPHKWHHICLAKGWNGEGNGTKILAPFASVPFYWVPMCQYTIVWYHNSLSKGWITERMDLKYWHHLRQCHFTEYQCVSIHELAQCMTKNCLAKGWKSENMALKYGHHLNLYWVLMCHYTRAWHHICLAKLVKHWHFSHKCHSAELQPVIIHALSPLYDNEFD